MAYSTKGAVVFTVDGKPRTFKYSLSVVDDKLRIWVEDTVTFEEWQTAELAIADFVTLDTAIPQAKAKDYAVNIAKSLEQSSNDGEPEPLCRSLSKPSADTGSRILFVAVVFKAMEFTTTLEYTFMLQSLPVDRTNKLLVENEQLHAENEKLQHSMKSLAVEVEELKIRDEELQTAVETLTAEIKQLKSHDEELQTSVDTLTAENEQLKTEALALPVDTTSGAKAMSPRVLQSPLQQLIMNGNQLVVVQADHWLFSVLCGHKQKIHEAIVGLFRKTNDYRTASELAKEPGSQNLTALLDKFEHVELATIEITQRRSNLFVATAATFGATYGLGHSLMTEIALARALRECPNVHNSEKLKHKVRFPTATVGDCQYIVGLFDILSWLPKYYETQIKNPQLKNLIKACVSEGRDVENAWFKLFDKKIMEPVNKIALHAYMAWIGQEFVTVDSRSGEVAEILLNPTQLKPDLPVYFPIGANIHKGLSAKVWKDHCGEIYKTRSDAKACTFQAFCTAELASM